MRRSSHDFTVSELAEMDREAAEDNEQDARDAAADRDDWTRTHAELAQLEIDLGREFQHDIDHDYYGPDWDESEPF